MDVEPARGSAPFKCSTEDGAAGVAIDVDAETFDAVAMVDALCGAEPDEADLFELMSVLDAQIVRVDEEILSVLRTQSQRSQRAHAELSQARSDIAGLNETMNGIQEQATVTQREVDALCQDIRAMNFAKQHLTKAISVLENFGTLTTALSELRETSSDSTMYRENASKLESVLCLMEKFEGYDNVPKVESVKDIVDVISRNLHQTLIREFQLLWTISDPFTGRLTPAADADFEEKERVRLDREQMIRAAKPKFDAISAAALMASALERRTGCRTAIVNDLVSKWMTTLHVTCLDLGVETGQALDDHFQSVFDWLLNVLSKNGYFVEQWRAIPSDWQVQRRLAERFCEEVEMHLTTVLAEWAERASGDLEERSTALLKALVVTREFERSLMSVIDNVRVHSGESSYDAIKARAETYLHPAEQGTPKRSEFEGKLRKIFSSHLNLVIDWHSEVLGNALRLLLDADVAQHWTGTVSKYRLDSARALMNECKDHCDKAMLYLNHSGTCVKKFVQMLESNLKTYAEALSAQLPATKPDLKRGLSTVTLNSLDDLRSICCIANTAEYVAGLVPDLQAFVAGGCPPEVSDGIDLSDTCTTFDDLNRTALTTIRTALLTEACKYIDGSPPSGVKALSRHYGAGIQTTGDSSPYATGIASVLEEWSTAICELLVVRDSSGAEDTISFEHVCSGMAAEFVRHLLHNGIMRLQKLNHASVNQLAIDLVVIKEALLHFPAKAFQSIEPAEARVPAASDPRFQDHRSIVEPAIQQAITLVKVLQVFDDNAFVQHYQHLLPQEYQKQDRMNKVLLILKLDAAQISKRLGLLRGNPVMTMATAQPAARYGSSATNAMANAANTWATNAATIGANMSAASSAKASSIMSGIIKPGQGLGTQRFGASDLVSTLKGRFTGVRR